MPMCCLRGGPGSTNADRLFDSGQKGARCPGPRTLGCGLRTATQKADAPMHRTGHQLRRSLASLIHEKRYDAIVVKEILARAGVARSTFCLHFGDKEDLLLSCIRHTLATERDRLPRGGDVVDRSWASAFPSCSTLRRSLNVCRKASGSPASRRFTGAWSAYCWNTSRPTSGGSSFCEPYLPCPRAVGEVPCHFILRRDGWVAGPRVPCHRTGSPRLVPRAGGARRACRQRCLPGAVAPLHSAAVI